MSRDIRVEICVDSVESAVAAEDGGADRVELCDNLVDGGTTPSFGMIELARSRLKIGLNVIIRPRGGDFLYSEIEFAVMKRDIEIAKQLGVDGVVFGMLNANGTIDTDRTAKLVEISRPMSVTFHRAFDVCRDPLEALDALMNIGVDRVLTSGQEPTAEGGCELIRRLVTAAGGRLTIMACGGLDESNLDHIISTTGVKEVHFTAFAEKESPMRFQNTRVLMGGTAPASEYSRAITDSDKVRRTINAARGN